MNEGRGGLRASDADREQAAAALKAAFVQGRLAKAEFEAHAGRALASRTSAELAAVTASIPAPAEHGPAAGRAVTDGGATHRHSRAHHAALRYLMIVKAYFLT
jgi:DUF1707 SHOCT-like domain